MNKVALIFNGPPNCGKDHACDYLERVYGIKHARFKDRLFELLRIIYSIDNEQMKEVYTRELKEQPTDLFNGLSPRQALIKISEHVIKPSFGKDYFGVAAARSLVANNVACFSDGGFIEEIEPIYEACGGKLVIARIYRDGCSFKNDSRNYIDKYKDALMIDIHNNSTLMDFGYAVEQAYSTALDLLRG